MQEKINKAMWILIPILLIGAGIFYYVNQTKQKSYDANFFYMNTTIYVKVYETNEKKAKQALEEIEKIYQTYHQLTDRYHSYEGITNLYTIHHNQENTDTLNLDPKLYQLLEYGKDWYQKSNGKLDISMGNVVDVWKQYREKGTGVPTIEELKNVNTESIDNIILLENNQIQNNHINMDLGAIAKGYTTELAAQYFEKQGIKNYLINAGGNVHVGKHPTKKKLVIGLEDPNSSTGEISKIIYGNNISVVTSGGYERYYEYQGIKYHHIIDPDTLFPTQYMKSVSVVTTEKNGDALSTILFLMPIEEGKKLVEQMDGVEAVWYSNDDELITSSGIGPYELK